MLFKDIHYVTPSSLTELNGRLCGGSIMEDNDIRTANKRSGMEVILKTTRSSTIITTSGDKSPELQQRSEW